MPDSKTIVIAGGGAAGIFAAITCAETLPDHRVLVLEKTGEFLTKVRISGGGRCNVTHSCFDPRELSAFYPRGGAALRGPFTVFQPRNTIDWFARRRVQLKTEPDGRMFPVTDSSQTIVNCLLSAARLAEVQMMPNRSVETATRDGNGFHLELSNGAAIRCDRLMLATGGCRTASAGHIPVGLGHSLVPPVPSLFAFHIAEPWLKELAGISLSSVQCSIPHFALRQSGPMVITHNGLSGPAILKLSAWGARELHQVDYHFGLKVNWLPGAKDLPALLGASRAQNQGRLVIKSAVGGLPARLWEKLVLATGIDGGTRWANLSKAQQHRLAQEISGSPFQVVGKSLNKEEFVTCGGVPLEEVDFKTMESRICPGLFFGGELLDIDGLTGGFNFQAAWTTGWIAGRSMSRE